MYRVLSKKIVFAAIAWFVIGLYVVFDSLEGLWNFSFRVTLIPTLAWILLNAMLWDPVWRFLWKKYPRLQKTFFPDLNGKWEVELFSNWPRQLQILEAANSSNTIIDMRTCPAEELAQLTPIRLEAKICQNWWKFEMKLYNPEKNTPIEKSNTISVDPFPKDGFRNPGICYFYEQENTTSNLADDNRFYGAARLEYDFEEDQLVGHAWTMRKWERAINTAAKLKFTRIAD